MKQKMCNTLCVCVDENVQAQSCWQGIYCGSTEKTNSNKK